METFEGSIRSQIQYSRAPLRVKRDWGANIPSLALFRPAPRIISKDIQSNFYIILLIGVHFIRFRYILGYANFPSSSGYATVISTSVLQLRSAGILPF